MTDDSPMYVYLVMEFERYEYDEVKAVFSDPDEAVDYCQKLSDSGFYADAEKERNPPESLDVIYALEYADHRWYVWRWEVRQALPF